MLLALAACGGSDDTETGSGGTADGIGATARGFVVKGPLQNAFVFADANGDGIFNFGEPSVATAADGSYVLTAAGMATIVAITNSNTIDQATGLVLNGVTLKAPAGSSVVSPLTTIVQETGLSPGAIAASLGVNSVDILNFNPYATGVDPAAALELEKLAQAVMTTMRSVAAASEGAGLSVEDAFAVATQAVSDIVSQQVASGGGASIDFASSATVSEILSTATIAAVAKGADVTKLDAVKGAVSAAITSVNSKIAAVTDLSSTEAKATFATSTTLANEVKAAANTGSASAVTLNNSANLDAAIADLREAVIEAGGGIDGDDTSVGGGSTGGGSTGGGSTGGGSTGGGSTGGGSTGGGSTGGGSTGDGSTGTGGSSGGNVQGTVTLNGVATQREILTANTSALSDPDGLGTFSYQWLANGSAINNATSQRLLLSQAEVGKAISVTVRYVDGAGSSETITSTSSSLVVNTNDAPVGQIVVDGTIAQGQSLNANTSTLSDADGLGTFSYQWLANGSAINNATSQSFLLSQAEVGKAISVTVRYVDGAGSSETITSTSSSLVVNTNDAPVGQIVVDGTIAQGQSLNANTSALSDADGLGTFSYQWLANGSAINNATSQSFLLSQAEVGKAISVTVRYVDGAGTPETITSTSSSLVINTNDAPVGRPIIAGNLTQGDTLTATTTNITDADGLPANLNFEWFAGGVAVPNSNTRTFALNQNEIGKSISVKVTYTDGGGAFESVTSLATGLVQDLIRPELIDFTLTPSSIVIEFSEEIERGQGSILIFNGNSAAEEISIFSSRIIVQDNFLVIEPVRDLVDDNPVSVDFRDAISDLSGNAPEGIILDWTL